MAPSATFLTAKLHSAVKEVFDSDGRDDLTVRLIRTKVEKELGLDDGFFLRNDWKEKSKKIIKDFAVKLIEEEEQHGDALPTIVVKVKSEPEKKPTPNTKQKPVEDKKSTKRSAIEEKPAPRKRQKKEETPLEDESSSLSDVQTPKSEIGDSDDSDAPNSKRKTKVKSRAAVKRQSKKKADVESDEDDIDESDESFGGTDVESDLEPPKKVKRESVTKRPIKKPKAESDEESAEDRPKNTKDEPPLDPKIQSGNSKLNVSKKDEPKSPSAVKREMPSKSLKRESLVAEDSDEEKASKLKAQDSDSSALSSVLDESPRPKRKSKTKSKPEPLSSKSPSSKSKPAAKPAKDLSPTEAQIKTLQSQLLRCGVRKIWGFELKQFGDDNTKKIRHLQGMLRDVGMVGRFSDARAREIKEMRELAADLEAVTEGDSRWGMGGRGVRNKAKERKSLKDESDEDDRESGDDDGKKSRSRSLSERPRDRRARVKQELAFLGDESDSD